jgi:two-component system, cell cycle sensor histidine kinase and response regulator CckA
MPKVAIVEDEYIVALDIKSFLERSGYVVAGMFASGEDLLGEIEARRPDLVLMDIKIRGRLDGVETARLVHDQFHTPVVLLTAYADDETIARAKITQPFGYIIKPFEERELKTAIEIALYRAGMERRLMESEERYRNLFHEGISANFLADPEGLVIEANSAFRALIGVGPEAPLPRLDSLVPDRAAMAAFMEMVASKQRLELEELPIRSLDGRDLVVLANAAVIYDSDGRNCGIQGELIDTTERRRLEERLFLAQKMEVAGRLAGGIAHDFNNILTAIIGYSNLLADELSEGDPARNDVEGIRKAADRASNLTRQLLAFSRRQPFSPRALDLNAAVQDAERLLRRILPEDVILSITLSPKETSIVADPAQIEQVLLNLAFNAKDAMPRGGELRMSTAIESLDAPQAVGLDTLAPGVFAVLGVEDTGTGIAPEVLDRIFEPFFTTKPKDRGTGLGLSTVYGIARQLGGAVGVSSKLGSGANFRVWIPFAKPAEFPAEKKSEESVWPAAPAATILFVDDDEAVRSLASRLLAKGGHRVLVAANAGEALLIAESYGPSIDLLITDTVMPFMDGRSLARRLLATLPSLGRLFISGQASPEADNEGEGLFLAKPFSEAELARAVSAALAEASAKRAEAEKGAGAQSGPSASL